VIDITHGVAPQQVLQGALVLADTLPYMPVGVHIAVVDPGVGGSRRALALRGGDGRVYVGPDNGLLLVACDRLGGLVDAVEIVNRSYMLEPVSPTFHGRDVFAAAGAHLARGVALDELGPLVDASELRRLEVRPARVEPGQVQATVVTVDRFGNVRLNLGTEELAEAGFEHAESVEIEIDTRRYAAVVARTFADVSPGKMIVYEDSSGRAAIAVNRGSAARMLGTLAGQGITLAAVRE
jgi:S-adenosylmethionine hydrolase